MPCSGPSDRYTPPNCFPLCTKASLQGCRGLLPEWPLGIECRSAPAVRVIVARDVEPSAYGKASHLRRVEKAPGSSDRQIVNAWIRTTGHFDAVVDLALSTISFHHWGDQATGLREVARALRPGGRFGLADISLPAWLAKLGRHPGARSKTVIRALFSQAGLQMRAQQRMLARMVLVTSARKDSGS